MLTYLRRVDLNPKAAAIIAIISLTKRRPICLTIVFFDKDCKILSASFFVLELDFIFVFNNSAALPVAAHLAAYKKKPYRYTRHEVDFAIEGPISHDF